jgi:hypothetical protein
MKYSGLVSDKVHEVAVYLAAAEAALCTRYPIAVVPEGRRFRLEVNGKLGRVFGRRTSDDHPLRRATRQDTVGAHALVFVDLSTDIPAFYVTPPDVASGEVEQYRDRWDRFDA